MTQGFIECIKWILDRKKLKYYSFHVIAHKTIIEHDCSQQIGKHKWKLLYLSILIASGVRFHFYFILQKIKGFVSIKTNFHFTLQKFLYKQPLNQHEKKLSFYSSQATKCFERILLLAVQRFCTSHDSKTSFHYFQYLNKEHPFNVTLSWKLTSNWALT